MNREDKVNQSQFVAVGFCALLSPTIRTLPSLVVPYAGEHAWISALAAIIPFLLLSQFMQRFLRTLRPDEGMSDLILSVLGNVLGRLLLIIFGIWMIFYAAFIMRISAHRFISTIFPESGNMAYIPLMGLIALITGLSPFKTLARSAEIIRPVLLFVLSLILVLSFRDVHPDTFSIPVANDVWPILKGIVPILNVTGILSYLSFLEGHTCRTQTPARSFSKSLILTAILLSALCFTTVGTFGPVVIDQISSPFFVMIRNLHILNTLEHVEALVIALWFFTDFVLVSMMIHASGCALSRALGIRIRRGSGSPLKEGRWLICLCALGATIWAPLMVSTTAGLTELAMHTVPALNLLFTLILLPVVFLIGRLRRRL